jgi:hypothetical protein
MEVFIMRKNIFDDELFDTNYELWKDMYGDAIDKEFREAYEDRYEYEVSYAQGDVDVFGGLLDEKTETFGDECEAIEFFESLKNNVYDNAMKEYSIVYDEENYFQYEDKEKMIIIELKELAIY